MWKDCKLERSFLCTFRRRALSQVNVGFASCANDQYFFKFMYLCLLHPTLFISFPD